MGIGMTLKSILRNRKMTIKQLSESSGISINTLYSITKRDSERVDEIILQRIADTLGVPIYELTGIWHELNKYKVVLKNYDEFSSKELTEVQRILEEGPSEDYGSLSNKDKIEFWKFFIDRALDDLNDNGMQKVAEYSLDLSKIPKYRRQPPAEVPPASPKDADTPAAQDAAEGAEEGE